MTIDFLSIEGLFTEVIKYPTVPLLELKFFFNLPAKKSLPLENKELSSNDEKKPYSFIFCFFVYLKAKLISVESY